MNDSYEMLTQKLPPVYISLLSIQVLAKDSQTIFSVYHSSQVGLTFEMLQLMWYGFGSKIWMMWAAGLLASVSSITYPAISAYVSTHTDADKQGMCLTLLLSLFFATS